MRAGKAWVVKGKWEKERGKTKINSALLMRMMSLFAPAFVEPWARTTIRLFEAVQAIGLATSGELPTECTSRCTSQTKGFQTVLR
jgi:hypothetical protein